MTERAKEIALKIIATAWPGCLVTRGMIDDTAAAVEKHMLRPHQVRDRDGDVWEQLSNGSYACLLQDSATTFRDVDIMHGPLTEIQGEPLPDSLKSRSPEKATTPEAIWQKINDNEWVFGVPVRGIIWQPIAKVIDGCDFFWHLTDLSQKGHRQHFRDAIEAATVAAEKAMGIS